VIRPVRGVYALPSSSSQDVELLVRRQILTCLSAAPIYGLWTVAEAAQLHVHHRRREAVDGPLHHNGLLLPPHPFRPVASLADVLIHALRCLPWQGSLVMVECAVARGDMTVEFLQRKLPGKRNGRAREVLRWVDRGADSVLETLARTYFRKAGVQVQAQVYIEGVGWVDLLLDGWLVVELDGRHHAEWSQVQKDHYRSNVSVASGYTVLHYYYSDVVQHPRKMLAQVLSVLGSRRAGER
jgi:very-short-patch-repair endonuclease